MSFNPPLPSVDVGVFPDHAHQRVFIALKQWDAGYEGNSIQETTLKLLQNSDNPRGPRTWELVSKTIRNDTELESFIKERYGKDCVSGQKAMTAQEGTFDVKISGFTPFDDPDGDCVVNYATVIRYSPSRQQVISWHMGQDVSFVSGKYPNWYVYDDDVVKSFRFLKK
ncbi:hypothetical protein EXS70_01730 [Candidatus Peribacteria bacterium]|nr:hypothetical protein [Candidatus Peribacteria bacterium]